MSGIGSGKVHLAPRSLRADPGLPGGGRQRRAPDRQLGLTLLPLEDQARHLARVGTGSRQAEEQGERAGGGEHLR
jgi:hypothetical protein